ncbi:MAG: DUF6089 family protein [Massilibacteroides sp.]|nr:DUF6089 family protein [Massilibacteroides sp.]
MTKTSFQWLIMVILLVVMLPILHAQEYKYEIGGMAGGAFYMGDANKTALFKDLNVAFGGVFRYNAIFRWAF